MASEDRIKDIAKNGVEYKAGFDPKIDLDVIEKKGVSEEVIRYISKKNNESEDILNFRLDAYSKWLKMKEPHWAAFEYDPINYDDIYFFAKPKQNKSVDDKIEATYKRLGVPLEEQKILKGQAVDAVVDSSSVRTTYGKQLLEMGIIFCPISMALQKYPDLVKKFLAHVVPPEDNFFAALNAAVFSDGTFVYIPKNVKCPIELSSYFRLQTEKLGQFERTLIVADEGSEVSYLEGCSAPIRDSNQLHSGVVELVACKGAKIKYSTVQNWYAGDENGKGGVYNFVTKRGLCFEDATISWTQLEVGSIKTWKYPSCILKGDRSKGEFFSVALTNNMQMTDTGTKMIHLGRDTTSTIITKGIALGKSVNGYRGMVKFAPTAENARNFTKCDTLVVGDNSKALALPDIIGANMSTVVEHEASVSSVSEEQLFFMMQRGLDEDKALGLIVNGFCSDIIKKLPAEFAMEAKELINISIEG
ncbi:MAG: Fe-S cluster assembly protein SufB [Alphaproteobacteria bacterium]|nr:Fe-S cluster assembly protein SufB [Alphaproteobacteria bacterium]